ncbi:MAG: hypothetical protein WBF21_11340 [Steroidobacteraceae bacterium]|jgi:hypothetical protein
MRFRLKALGLHLSASACVLSLILGALYFGWYYSPGWRLTDVAHVVIVMVGVDVVVGPLLTFIVARASKPRRELARDISMIVFVQLCALTYGSVSLWDGRPLYYAYSETVLQLVQAYDIDAQEAADGRRLNPEFAAHWYSRPRWVWAPLPADNSVSQHIVLSAIKGGDDVISMPRYFKPWNQGLPTLRLRLKKVDDVAYFIGHQKKQLKERMRAAGLATDQPNAMPLIGRGFPLLAVFDPASVTIKAILSVP